MRSRRSVSSADSTESRYAKGKTAEWLVNIMESGIFQDCNFLNCVEWILGGLRNVALRLESELKTIVRRDELANAKKDIKNLLYHSGRGKQIHDDIYSFIRDYQKADEIVEEAIRDECLAAAKTLQDDGAVYRRAKTRLRSTFGLSEDACAVCEFLFIQSVFEPVEDYFIHSLDITKFAHRKKFSDMLRMKPHELRTCLSELVSWGICDKYYDLEDGLDLFWEDSSVVRAENLFYRPLLERGKASSALLPLKDFGLPAEDIAHVRALLKSESKAPVHILLYGEPGTGKTTFARSLARELNLKAWAVPCNDDTDESDRRAALSACLNMTSKHKGAFVMLDEAERFLDTGDRFGRETKDKAWLNDFLEKPNRRVIWIVNDIDHVHPAVRRRFTFSLYFKPLDRDERRRIWQSILEKQNAVNLLPEEQVKKFVNSYPVAPAVVESAVRQAKAVARTKRGKADFAGTAERVLRSHVTLAHSGETPRMASDLLGEPGEYALNGVSLESSINELLEKCRRIDAMMKEEKLIRPGGATMLFYGPPGTGKSALAKYLANEMGRELVIKRASDLLSCWVGESEKNVARAFRNAEKDILVIDEVDSFLYSRDSSAHSWENTLVNEFLTSLERCRGFCVCTSNRLKDLDEAALRRFSFKIAFGYAGPEQAKALYKSLLAPLVDGTLPENVAEALSNMRCLAPGDFHVVKSQYWLAAQGEATHEKLLENLAREEKLKRDGQGRTVGF